MTAFRVKADNEMTMLPEITDQLIKLGIRQDGDEVLRRAATPFDLPREAASARRLWKRLRDVTTRVQSLYDFTKGIGLAAPQIGVSRRLAVVRMPGESDICLLNPRLLWESPDTDQKYEGCLSLFQLRGLVQRPLRLRIEVQQFNGTSSSIDFGNATARLVAHEVDHLNGVLYTDRTPAREVLSWREYAALKRRDWTY